MTHYECSICKLLPFSHSLTRISEKKGVLYFYTCPSKSKLYYDVQGILNHYNGVLSEIPEDKDWVWILDSIDFSIAHAMQTTVAIELAKLITSKFSKNLKRIVIINPTFFVKMTHTMVMPFLSDEVKRIIEINPKLTKAEEIFL